MSPPKGSYHAVIQGFASAEGEMLPILPTYECAETGERYILWNEDQQAFKGVDHLEYRDGELMLFAIESNGELIRPLRIKYEIFNAYTPVYNNTRVIQTEIPQHVLQGSSGSSYISMAHVDNQDLEGTVDLAPALRPRYLEQPDLAMRQYRLYFLCDIQQHNDAPQQLLQHVRLYNHPGYNLRKTGEFFQICGDYVLRVHQMVKHGYTGANYEIPPLHTFKILLGCDPNIIGGHLYDRTLALFDKAIDRLQEVSSLK
ncbi:hypothetical protein BG000_010733 [Podila horticola]|nr:hypothetical protein BG000_010733 [Podila horticola]